MEKTDIRSKSHIISLTIPLPSPQILLLLHTPMSKAVRYIVRSLLRLIRGIKRTAIALKTS